MVNWQVTATTIYCEAVNDEVTIMVYKDGSVKCSGYKKYGESGRETGNLAKKKQTKGRLECEGPQCYRGRQYRDRLFAEEEEGERLRSSTGEKNRSIQGEGGG